MLSFIAAIMIFTSGVAVGVSDVPVEYVCIETPAILQTETVASQLSEVETDILTPEAPIVPETPIVAPQSISADFDITQPCGYTADELRAMVDDNSRNGMLPYIDILLEAEEKYGVNAFYLLCKFGYESGWGKHMAASNNIGGWTNGQGGYRAFDSVEQCIFTIAENLSTVYVDTVGTRLADVSHRYCPNEEYVSVLLQIMRERANAVQEV